MPDFEDCEGFRKTSWTGTAKNSLKVLLVAPSIPRPSKALTSSTSELLPAPSASGQQVHVLGLPHGLKDLAALAFLLDSRAV